MSTSQEAWLYFAEVAIHSSPTVIVSLSSSHSFEWEEVLQTYYSIVCTLASAFASRRRRRDAIQA